jgi:hypothetical protein
VRRRFALTALLPGEGLQDYAHRAAIEPRLAGMHPSDRFQNQIAQTCGSRRARRDHGALLGGRVAKTGKDKYRRLAGQVR